MVTFIAGYHYLRIFDSYKHATSEGTFNVATDVNASSVAFNEGYRYVDWILTVPLLLVEVIAVLALAKEASKSLITRLVPADRQPEGVAATIGRLRLLLIASWGVYPISYLLPIIDADGAASSGAFVGRQVGYTIADVVAKCVWGLTILKIARMKSIAEGMKDDH